MRILRENLVKGLGTLILGASLLVTPSFADAYDGVLIVEGNEYVSTSVMKDIGVEVTFDNESTILTKDGQSVSVDVSKSKIEAGERFVGMKDTFLALNIAYTFDTDKIVVGDQTFFIKSVSENPQDVYVNKDYMNIKGENEVNMTVIDESEYEVKIPEIGMTPIQTRPVVTLPYENLIEIKDKNGEVLLYAKAEHADKIKNLIQTYGHKFGIDNVAAPIIKDKHKIETMIKKEKAVEVTSYKSPSQITLSARNDLKVEIETIENKIIRIFNERYIDLTQLEALQIDVQNDANGKISGFKSHATDKMVSIRDTGYPVMKIDNRFYVELDKLVNRLDLQFEVLEGMRVQISNGTHSITTEMVDLD